MSSAAQGRCECSHPARSHRGSLRGGVARCIVIGCSCTDFKAGATCPECQHSMAWHGPGGCSITDYGMPDCHCSRTSSGQLGGKDDVRQVQGPRLDTSSPEHPAATCRVCGAPWPCPMAGLYPHRKDTRK